MNAITNKDKNNIFKQAQHGCMDHLKLVHERHPDFHWSSLTFDKTGDTVLHICAQLGHSKMIEYLLENFSIIAVDCKNNFDKSPLHIAAQFFQLECCKTLLRYGAEVNAIKQADWTPLMLACAKNNKDIQIDYGPDVLNKSDDALNTVEFLLKNGAMVNLKNKDGWTALHLISREGNLAIFNTLLNYKADPHLKTKNGRSILHIASLHGNLAIVKKCVEIGLYIEEQEVCGNTPLQEALLGKNLTVCDFLVDAGANALHKNHSDLGMLHLAASIGDVVVIKHVINSKTYIFNVNEQNRNGWTPLQCAARKKFKEAYDFLVKSGANENIKDNFGRVAQDYFN